MSAMHSIPPLVTISSACSGRRPCSCSWRSIRYSRTLGDPLARRVLQRDGGVVAHEPRRDLVELVGRERRRVGEAAGHREHAGRAAGEDRGQLVAAAQPRPAREGRREVSHPRERPARWPRRGRAPRRARRGSSGRAAPRREPAPRGSRARRARSARPSPARPRSAARGAISSAVVVAEHDVARATPRRRRRAIVAPGARARHGRAGPRRRAAREHRQPDARAGRARRGRSRR